MQPSMKIFVDTTKQTFMCSRNSVPKIGDRKTGTQKIDLRTSLPMWSTQLTVFSPDGASVIEVTTVGQTAPTVSVGESVVPEELEALPWSNKDRDGEVRMGIAFRASGLRALTPAV